MLQSAGGNGDPVQKRGATERGDERRGFLHSSEQRRGDQGVTLLLSPSGRGVVSCRVTPALVSFSESHSSPTEHFLPTYRGVLQPFYFQEIQSCITLVNFFSVLRVPVIE